MVKPTQDRDTSDLKTLITEKQLMELAGKLGSDWRQLGIQYLGMSFADTQNFESQEKTQTDIIFKMLYIWRCREKEKATVWNLIKILREADVDVDAWKSLSPNNDLTDMRCKCCQSIFCKCQCNLCEDKTILVSSPVPKGYECTIKCKHVRKFVTTTISGQKKAALEIDDLLMRMLSDDNTLRLDIISIFHGLEGQLLKITIFC
ncbi:uncharacterized protein LOC103176795 [Callorhinchus milii]|uniref:uncharacterized protein LOC103176795 n=1 Tax=Callorhinchus milii TaxID=7868 RepID=UPI0004573FEE|nr:uncharacterized protein LOC103176795 [Callorhinchus milii]|eukprot:gi/632946824/ref/XP_007888749.1/ PREDICTED: uncharacterized protein LOC103176795 [Callorhinchus milii]